MRLLGPVLAVVIAVGCTRNPRTTEHPPGSPGPSASASPAPAPDAALAAAPATRCLPVVAKECNCVYTCGTGRRDPAGDGTYIVTHDFWPKTELRARIEPWCVDGQCTDVFAAEIVCDGVCAPKPADPSCTCAK